MPQKACERCIFHVIVFSLFFEIPQNRRISLFHFFMFEFFKARFSYLILKKLFGASHGTPCTRVEPIQPILNEGL